MIELCIFNQRYLCRTKDLLWWRETRQVIYLIVNEKKTLADIKTISKQNNIFNAVSSSRANEICMATYRRITAVNSAFLQFFIAQDMEMQKVLCVVMIMLTDRMFMEFMDFVYREKLIRRDLELYDSDIVGYIHSIQNKDEYAAKWTDGGIKKVKDNYKAILKDAGMISDSGKERRILKPIIKPEVQDFLEREGLERLEKILAGEHE